MMAIPAVQSSVPEIRTYALDVRRAQAKFSTAEESAPPAEEASGIAMPHGAQQALADAERGNGTVPLIGGDIHVPENSSEAEILDIRKAASGERSSVIVKESRSKQWSFSEEAKKALIAWWSSFGSGKKSGVSIAPAARRAPIIKAASLDAKIAPQDDHAALVERLRKGAGPDNSEKNSELIQDVPANAVPQWTYTDPQEKQKNLEEIEQILAGLETSKPTNATSPSIKRGRTTLDARSISFAHENVMPKEREEMLSPDMPHEQSDDAVPVQQVSAPKPEETMLPLAPEETENEIVGQPEAEKETVEAEAESEKDVPAAAVNNEETAVPAAPESERESLVREMRSTGPRAGDLYAMRAAERATERLSAAPVARSLAPLITYIGGIIFAVGFVIGGYYLFVYRDTPIITRGAPSLFATARTVDIDAPEGRVQMLSVITTELGAATGDFGSLVRFNLVEEGTRAVTTQSFLNTVSTRISGSLVRTAGDPLVLGAYIDARNTPFIVFPVRSRDAALAGMLEWEQYMGNDLAQLFGEPSAEAAFQARFKDEVVVDVDARVFYGENGSVEIIYALVEGGVVVITGSRPALAAIREALRAK